MQAVLQAPILRRAPQSAATLLDVAPQLPGNLLTPLIGALCSPCLLLRPNSGQRMQQPCLVDRHTHLNANAAAQVGPQGAATLLDVAPQLPGDLLVPLIGAL